MVYVVAANVILTLLLIFSVILLYLRQNQMIGLEKKYEHLNRELENSITAFLMEIREENEEFLEKLKKLKTSESQTFPIPKEEPEGLSSSEEPQDKNAENPSFRPFIGEKVDDHISINRIRENPSGNMEAEFLLSEGEKDSSSKNPIVKDHESITKKVQRLLEEGLSIPEIAKELDKGKTEIELLVKFDPTLLAALKKQKGK